MSTPEQELKRLLHFGRNVSCYQPGYKLFNEFCHSSVQSSIENLVAAEKLSDVTGCIVKAFSDGYSAHPEMLVYALAVCAKQQTSEPLREAAYKAVKTVCSSPENLFLFIKFATKLSQNNSIWGSGCRKVLKDWYLKKDVKTLAEIVSKQGKYHGWSHKDVIKLIHLKTDEPARAAVIKYVLFGIKAAKKEYGENAEASEVLNYLQTVEDFKHLTDVQQAARNIEIHKFTLEHVPSHLIKKKEIWGALVGTLPLSVLLSNLKRMDYMGFLKFDTPLAYKVVDALKDENAIAESRLHPAQVFLTLINLRMSSKYLVRVAQNARKKHKTVQFVKTRGEPNFQIVSALYDLFASTCKLFLAPTGLRYFVVIDLRSLMWIDKCLGSQHVNTEQAAVVIALCLLRADRNVSIRVAADNEELVPFKLTPCMDFQRALIVLEEAKMQPVKISTPLEWALKKKEEYDVFVVIKDVMQTGDANPVEALKKYREEMKIPNAKLITVSLKSRFGAAWVKEKNDAGMFHIEGFDGNVPRIIEAFSRGAF